MVQKASIEARNVVADYFTVFNNEIRRFLDPLWCKSELSSSYIHINSTVKWINMGNTEDIVNESDSDSSDDEGRVEGNYCGVFWSPEEKEIFFHFLSRASIHRLDEWAVFLPQKSKFEIEAYHAVLSRNLKELKKLDSKRHGGILAKKELPIAYQMDECFVELEEQISRNADEELATTETVETEAVLSDEHVQMTQMEVHDREEANSCEGLIGLENWSKRWRPVYSKTGIKELQPASKIALPFSESSLKFSEKCVESHLRKILWYSILPNLERKHVPRSCLLNEETLFHSSDHPEEEDEVLVKGEFKSPFPHVVTEEDVWKGLAAMRQEGLAAPTLAETVLSTLKKYKLKHKEGRIFKTSRLAMGVVPRILAHTEAAQELESFARKRYSPSMNGEDRNAGISTGFMTSYGGHRKGQKNGPFDHIHQKLFQMNGKKRDAETFIEGDSFDVINNPLEQTLCDLETEKLEEHDTYNSQQYQHALLKLLQGGDKCMETFKLDPPRTEFDTETIPESIQREFQYE
ncbi:LAME_0G11540g1_1 [Lachancea meyersii CBS 8951]|uniref:LAME_0G11540g1_1 n=1 Tax=Lachancea meyersii CBS 8951 TaxID=1266667 RepID=A0A1G4K9B8_9SACH|nr:LAME_0G11540g1_1 [Lachancea meyersii CBS 8951]